MYFVCTWPFKYWGNDYDVNFLNRLCNYLLQPDPETKMPFELTMDDLENALAKAKKQVIVQLT